MRFHRFQVEHYQEAFDEIFVDLDTVVAVFKRAENRTYIMFGPQAEKVLVVGRCHDIMRLVSPPAAPDTYEEDLARIKREGPGGIIETPPEDDKPDGFKDHRRRTVALNKARVFELRLLQKDVRLPGAFVNKGSISAYINNRIAEIESGAAGPIPTATPTIDKTAESARLAEARLDELNRVMSEQYTNDKEFWPTWAQSYWRRREEAIVYGGKV